MIVNIPPHVERVLKDRAVALVEFGDSGKYRPGSNAYTILLDQTYRSLCEAWSEGVMYAWTVQDIEES